MRKLELRWSMKGGDNSLANPPLVDSSPGAVILRMCQSHPGETVVAAGGCNLTNLWGFVGDHLEIPCTCEAPTCGHDMVKLRV
jgi:hypothetical protein